MLNTSDTAAARNIRLAAVLLGLLSLYNLYLDRWAFIFFAEEPDWTIIFILAPLLLGLLACITLFQLKKLGWFAASILFAYNAGNYASAAVSGLYFQMQYDDDSGIFSLLNTLTPPPSVALVLVFLWAYGLYWLYKKENLALFQLSSLNANRCLYGCVGIVVLQLCFTFFTL